MTPRVYPYSRFVRWGITIEEDCLSSGSRLLTSISASIRSSRAPPARRSAPREGGSPESRTPMPLSPTPPPSPPPPSSARASTTAYFLSFIALGLGGATLGPTLPSLAEQTGVTLSGISYLFTFRSLGYLIGSLNGGRLVDRLPGHAIVAATLVVSAAMLALVPIVPVIELLCAVMFVMGAAEATLDVGCNTLLVWLHRKKLGPVMNALHFFFGVGALIAPLIVGRVMVATGGIAWAYWLIAILVLPPAVALLRLPSPSNPAHTDPEPPVQTRPLLVLLIAGCFFLIVGAEVGFASWIYTYALELGLADAAGAAYLTSAFWAAFTVGRLVMIPVAARVRPGVILMGDLLGCLLGIGIIAMWPASASALWAGAAVFGLSIASLFATLFSLANDHMSITGRITGWFFVGTSSGAMTVPWIIGQFFESVGPSVTLTVVAVDLLVALVLFGAVLLAARRRPAVASGRAAAD